MAQNAYNMQKYMAYPKYSIAYNTWHIKHFSAEVLLFLHKNPQSNKKLLTSMGNMTLTRYIHCKILINLILITTVRYKIHVCDANERNDRFIIK